MDVVKLETMKTEKEVVADLRARTEAKLAEVALILDDANRAGMRITFNIGVDGFGRNVVQSLEIMKPMR